MQIQKCEAIEGAKELIIELGNYTCLKAVVSGSARKEVEDILDKNIGLNNFDLIITGDDVAEGKPEPLPFQMALEKLNIQSSEAIVVENSPLGVEAAVRAGIQYIITLNNTPLDVSSDFRGVGISDHRIFKNTKSASALLRESWCN